MQKYTASVVGGGMGGELSMSALEASQRFELVAVCDIAPDVCTSLRRDYPNVEVFSNHADMFKQAPTDVVCVATSAPSHKQITLDALATLPLKGILVEKPLADTVADGRELLDAIKAKRLPMCVPHNLLVAKHANQIIERVRDGQIGDLQLIEIQCDKWDIINAGIHWLNFVVMLTGCEQAQYVIAQCDSSTRTYRDGMQVETLAVTYIQTTSGIRVVMNTGDYVTISREGKGTLFRLVGTQGVIEFWAWESAYQIFNAEFPGGKTFEVTPYQQSGHQLHLEAMAQLIDSGKTDYTVPDSSLMALELVEAAYLSNAHGCKVDLPLASFTPPARTDWQPGQPYSGTGGGRDGRKLE